MADGAEQRHDQAPVIEVRGVTKGFGGTRALDDAHLALHAGEVHALLGENGAGKSTLIKVMTGLHRADRGEVLVDGAVVEVSSTADGQRLGVVAVYQEPLIFPDLTVAENIFIGHRDRGLLVDWKRMQRDAEAVLRRLDLDLDPMERAASLTVGEQQAVEIARALSREVRVLIMDEPTAALSTHEVRRLFRQVEELKREGVAVLFISHRLDEVFEIADRITVFRDGRHISTRPADATDEATVVREMVGRELGELFTRTRREPGEVALAVGGLGRSGAFSGVDLEVNHGEVLGLAGLVGAGRTDIALALFGIAPADQGWIEVAGRRVTIRTPADAMANGIAYVSEDRRKLGLSLPQSIAANISLPRLRSFLGPLRLIDRQAETAVAETFRDMLSIRSTGLDAPVGQLSGGNQQKVMLAKWLHTEPRILILDEPTRGIDVGAKADVHRLIDELAGRGMAVIMISSDLPEVLAMSDRVLVMREGTVAAVLDGVGLDAERVMSAAVGSAP